MKILVTAFGPFDGRPENASSLAVQGLKRALPEIHTRILPVDSVVAPARLKQAIRRIRPSLLVMLGEAAGSGMIRLESTAWNEMNFPIPDIAGRQPPVQPIQKGGPATRTATLPLQEIHTLLETDGHAVALSTDPGRYLCNQVFFIAMEYLEARAVPCRAGFIHLPLARDYPSNRATDALVRAIRWMTSGTQT